MKTFIFHQTRIFSVSKLPRTLISVGIGLIFLPLLSVFQNCAKDPKYSTSLEEYMMKANADAMPSCGSGSTPPAGGMPPGGVPPGGIPPGANPCAAGGDGTKVLSYPSSDQIILKPGQSITLKIQKPANMSNPTSWYWYAVNDGYSLKTYYGKPFFDGTHFYISVHVIPNYAQQKNFQILFYEPRNRNYFTQNGLSVTVMPSASQTFNGDFKQELCSKASDLIPTISFNRSNSMSPLLIVDAGTGLESSTCKVGAISVDCFNQATWPINWISQSFLIQGATRCGKNFSQSF